MNLRSSGPTTGLMIRLTTCLVVAALLAAGSASAELVPKKVFMDKFGYPS